MTKFTQSMTLHLNGGSKFSELHYEVLADGKKTHITRHTRTDGSPHYYVTADELHFGEETFDIRRDKDMMQWLEDRKDKRPDQ